MRGRERVLGSILETVLYNGDKRGRTKTMQSNINRRDSEKKKEKEREK